MLAKHTQRRHLLHLLAVWACLPALRRGGPFQWALHAVQVSCRLLSCCGDEAFALQRLPFVVATQVLPCRRQIMCNCR